ncbi:MAG: peptide chain release factor N(5)-glutamine methyltransferase [Candidatus Eremiobacteraeota bacterium]|nr:peptide chain release factor N(5)-glutamine methyltransferase [Candidatus Eremiobacteraeota bacterium]
MNLKDLYNKGKEAIKRTGYGSFEVDARVLLLHSVGISAEHFYAHATEYIPSKAQIDEYENLIRKRVARTPVAYITGKREFMGIEFTVNRSVLIPRPATEILVEKALEVLEAGGWLTPQVADIGCGSGNIALSLAYYNPYVHVTATDVSSDSLDVARLNLDRISKRCPEKKIGARIELVPGSLYEPFRGKFEGSFSMIVSNPPYVTQEEWEALMDGVRIFEPKGALCPPGEPEEFYRKIVADAILYLQDDGFLVLEIGSGQGDVVKGIFEKLGYKDIFLIRDLEGFDRVVGGRYEHLG